MENGTNEEIKKEAIADKKMPWDVLDLDDDTKTELLRQVAENQWGRYPEDDYDIDLAETENLDQRIKNVLGTDIVPPFNELREIVELKCIFIDEIFGWAPGGNPSDKCETVWAIYGYMVD